VFVLLTLFLLLISCKGDVNPFYIQTSDGLKISANFFPVDSDKGVVLLHMLDGEKNDWNSIVPKLTANKFNVLAIDLRGHGMSSLDWRDFSETDFSRAVLDIVVAKSYLEEKGVTKIGVIGASIGANLALKYASQDKNIDSLVLLSPSFNYKGVKTSEDVLRFEGSALIIVDKEDSQSADDSLQLYISMKEKGQLMILENVGHGTAMLKDERVPEVILSWLKKTI
ncbi:MAG: alpha/beta hydrolase, partial [Nanoarchaeota archaeon]|nr:alpha/beta hydrolase [Nanoarchaeota archaeon]MBU1854307.1 alpha/beta hydrolase [Nanoarchaeota archaeon]